MAQDNEEVQQLCELFPTEVWTDILDNLSDTDIVSCSAATSLFKQLLSTRKLMLLLPQVLKVFDKTSYLNDDPQLMRSCRQVCSAMSSIIDKYLEIRPYHFKATLTDYGNQGFPPEASNDPASGTFFRMYSIPLPKFEQQIVPELILPFYKEHNPFPSRHLDLLEGNWCTLDVADRYRTAAIKILLNVGHHVWHVQIRIYLKPVTCFYQVLHDYIRLLPNLKSLYLIHMPLTQRDTSSQLAQTQFRGYCELISNQARRSPIPTLPNLVLLSMQDLPDTAMEAVLNPNRHVKALEIVPNRSIHWNLAVCRGYFRSVSQVGKDLTSLSMALVRLEDVTKLRNEWKLESLRLECTMLPNPIVHWSTIWEKVEHYSDTLTELAVHMLYDDFCEMVPSVTTKTLFPVKLPKVKKLWISLPGDCSIDFLLGCKSLEYLSLRMTPIICVDESGAVLSEQITPKVIVAEDVLKCNIWEKIPTLKVMDWWNEDTDEYETFNRKQVQAYKNNTETSMM